MAVIDLATMTAEIAGHDREHPMKVTFHGKLAGALGREVELAVETPCTVAALRDRIAAAYPQIAQPLADPRVRACVGSSLVPDHHPLAATDEVEFLAPVSGG